MSETRSLDGRMVWVDWMKVWAMWAVIWGHFFAKGDVYVYMFNLQVFCVLSGFLYKKSPDWRSCLTRCFWQLLIPTVILSLVMHGEAWLRCIAQGDAYPVSWLWFARWLFLGHQWCMGPCWYFYSLIVMRILMQLLPEGRWAYVASFLALSAGAVAWHQMGMEASNANVNVLLCMPFFLIGVLLRPWRARLSGWRNLPVECVALVVSVASLLACARWNGYVWMYLCDYGNSYLLFIIGGMSGAVILYVVSHWLERLPYRSMVVTLSRGSILIVGLHYIVVRRLVELPDRLWGDDLLCSLLLLLLFVPLVRLAELFCPLLLGRRK